MPAIHHIYFILFSFFQFADPSLSDKYDGKAQQISKFKVSEIQACAFFPVKINNFTESEVNFHSVNLVLSKTLEFSHLH